MESQSKLTQIDRVFSPSAPIKTKDLFLGRLQQLAEVSDSIQERGQHIVLYGERGVGKTSLANIISAGLHGIVSAKVTCNRRQNFKDVWNAALAKIRMESTTPGVGFNDSEKKKVVQLNGLLPSNLEELSPSDIENILEKIDVDLLLIFDEFDSITDDETKIRFADIIKSLSDNASHVTILIVGIADSVTDLIGEHPSLERCLKQIRMPRMSDKELESIIHKGIELLQMTIDENVSKKIVRLSLGFPHFTHLLSKYSARTAIESRSDKITNDHFDNAIDACISNTDQTIRNSYQKATITSREESKFEDVIGACATAPTDEYETFSTNDLITPYYQITLKKISRESLTYYLSRLCTDDRGILLEKAGTSKNIRYRFRNPLMRAYARLKLSQQGKLNPDAIQTTQSQVDM